ncbi:LuxR C-terminal-related transcriptional regulator [Namhaeicola litoreus]|uniref:LuxR C-terminal-related transcriptional regulator n=1 Tax=Namhaeicola litoreus TaxID=1052145 RepID=A0ABW3XYM0_9FLAO
MLQFLAELPTNFKKMQINGQDFIDYENILLQSNECIFVVDFFKNALVYANGFPNTWGYEDEEITLELIIENIHPDDKELVNKIIKAAILHSIQHVGSVNENILTMTYRCKKKDKTYAKYLSQSVALKTDDNGAMVKNLVRLTDISFIDSSNHVFWDFHSNGLNKKKFKKMIYEEQISIFTNRELEVIQMILKNLSNQEISKQLNISINTVSTHRKNIMRKSGCHNAHELIDFCKGKGIL